MYIEPFLEKVDEYTQQMETPKIIVRKRNFISTKNNDKYEAYLNKMAYVFATGETISEAVIKLKDYLGVDYEVVVK